MVAGPKKPLALDANLLLDLAEQKDFAHDFREEFADRGYSFLVPPTVLAELEFLASMGQAPQSDFANTALAKLGNWQCEPFVLSATGLAIAHRFGERLIDLRLIPETERNEGKILAQTSLVQIPLSLRMRACWTSTKMRCCCRSTKRTCFRCIRFTRNVC